MKKFTTNLLTLIGICALGIGVSNAAPSSSDCGDEDVKPITIHSSAKVNNKES